MKFSTIPNNVKTIIASVVLLAAFLTTAFAFDGRYLHVVQFTQYVNQKEKREIEDKIFALEIKKNRTREDDAFLNRYRRQLDELNRRMSK